MRNTAFLALGVALLILQANLHRLVSLISLPGATPSLVLPVVLFMGVNEYSLARGAALAFLLGYLLDLFAGAPGGVFTFITVASFVVSRLAGVRLSAQSVFSQMSLALVFALVEGVLVVVFTALFGLDVARPRALARLILPHAISTALFAPIVFRAAAKVHQATMAVAGAGSGEGPAA